MQVIFERAVLWILFLACPCSVCAQQATANHNVILRRDPTVNSKALEHLIVGARLTLVDATPDSGFYHVRTEDDQVGWIFAKYISISEVTTTLPPATPSTAVPAS